MEELRNELLISDNVSLYQDILNFLRSPSKIALVEILSHIEGSLQQKVKLSLEPVLNQYLTDKDGFYKYITLGQVVIWQEILNSYLVIRAIVRKIERFSIYPDTRNYRVSCEDLSTILGYYADMQAELTYLEDTLGVDRFLDRINEGTFSLLNSYVIRCKSIIEERCDSYKRVFQKEWNSTNIFNVLCHKLIRYDKDNPICDLVCGSNQQVILFVIDGFGYCQYLWHKSIDSKRKNYTFKENIFNWLAETGCSKELILGSSYITDTAAGLAQIFSGCSSKNTGVIASKVYKRNSPRNFEATKTLIQNDFDMIFDAKSNSITDIVRAMGYDSTVYYCSKYQDPASGFSNFIYKSGEVKQILPPERVFSVLEADISKGTTSGLQVIYHTGIDNSGHTMGAYSGFEKYEHQKLGELFKNFLIELGQHHPEMYDGTRSIMVTADHGMFESSKRIISRYMLQELLHSAGYCGFKLVENNRAMFFYLERKEDTNSIVSILKEYFDENDYSIDVSSANDSVFTECISENTDGSKLSNIIPDIVARFVGNGLFYTNSFVNNHLLHYGGHGGYSIDEVFIPLIEICLDNRLLSEINTRFLSKM